MALIGDRTEFILSAAVTAGDPIPIGLITPGRVSPLDALSGIGDAVQARFVAEHQNGQDWMIFDGTPDANAGEVSTDTLIKSTTGSWLDLPAGSRLFSDRDANFPEGLLPAGGSQNQVLAKKSAADFDADWSDQSASPSLLAQNYGADRAIAFDTFDRADAGPGPDALGTADSGQAWTGEDLSGVSWLTSGRWSYPQLIAKHAQPGGGIAAQWTVATLPISDAAFTDDTNIHVIRFVLDMTSRSAVGAILKWVDNENYLSVEAGANNGRQLAIVERVQGTRTKVALDAENINAGLTRSARVTADLLFRTDVMYVFADATGGGWGPVAYERPEADDTALFAAFRDATTCGLIFNHQLPTISRFSVYDLRRAF